MKLERIISVVVGAAAFGFAHGLVTGGSLRATFTPDPMIRPWFTNATGSVAVTAAVVAIAAFAYALTAADRRAALSRGVTVGVGAIVAMLAVMVRIGIGNLGPIVFAVGGAVLLAAGAVGGSLAAVRKRA